MHWERELLLYICVIHLRQIYFNPFTHEELNLLGKTISWRAARQLIVLHPKENIESERTWQTFRFCGALKFFSSVIGLKPKHRHCIKKFPFSSFDACEAVKVYLLISERSGNFFTKANDNSFHDVTFSVYSLLISDAWLWCAQAFVN